MKRACTLLLVAAFGCGGPDPAPAPEPQPPQPEPQPPQPEPQPPQPQPSPPQPQPAQPQPPQPPPLDAAFSGTWIGIVTLSFPASSSVYGGFIVIAVSGQNATVSAVCPDGSGSISTKGSGSSAEWHGSHTCPPADLGFRDCRAITLVHRDAAMTLHSKSRVTVVATGVATGCGTTVPFTETFDSG